MKETVTKNAPAKKEKEMNFRIATAEGDVKQTHGRPDALSFIADLQKENVSPIYLHDDKEQKSLVYKKDRYEQNYRVKSSEYQPAQTQKTEEVPAE